MGIEEFDKLCEVSERSGQAVDLVDDDDIAPSTVRHASPYWIRLIAASPTAFGREQFRCAWR
jgi:hypothetical protein